MKKIFVILGIACSFLILANAASAQTMSGRQVCTGDNKIKSKSRGVKIDKVVRIVRVRGNNAGFWIRKGNNIIRKYWKPNDASVIGLELQPGMYYVYPNIPKDESSGDVVLRYE